eukprot:24455-Chlamydomonas_euryale.AAC.4
MQKACPRMRHRSALTGIACAQAQTQRQFGRGSPNAGLATAGHNGVPLNDASQTTRNCPPPHTQHKKAGAPALPATQWQAARPL